MRKRFKAITRWRPRSLHARQLLVASAFLIAFLALAGYALDRAFANTAENDLRQRLQSYAMAYANNIDFARDGALYMPEHGLDPMFDQPGSGLYAVVVLPNARWTSRSAEGPILPETLMLDPIQEVFGGPYPMTQTNGTTSFIYRYGIGLVWSGTTGQEEIPYSIFVMENTQFIRQKMWIFRSAIWVYLGGVGVLLLLLQTLILQWGLRPLRQVTNELARVQNGQSARMSHDHPTELEPLTESINALIDSQQENVERQRNTLADLAHSLKTPLAVLKTQVDSETDEAELRSELKNQLQKMNALVSYQLTRAAMGGHALFTAPIEIAPYAEDIVSGLEKVYAQKSVLCEFDIDENARFYGNLGDLQELLGNLLENAFKWANKRVLLTIRIGNAPVNRRAGLFLAVDDDGPGIAEEDIPKVLQRGVRGDERVQGHGIGLSIVQDLIRDYRGELHVSYSDELKGARFEVTLPAGP